MATDYCALETTVGVLDARLGAVGGRGELRPTALPGLGQGVFVWLFALSGFGSGLSRGVILYSAFHGLLRTASSQASDAGAQHGR